MRRTLHARLVMTVLACAGTGLACFSERQATTAPNGSLGQCSVAIAPPFIGTTQAVIAMRNYSFNPDTLRITPGTTVTWVNCEPANIDAHTSSATGGQWKSGYLPPGAIYTRKFNEVGRFDYACEPHPFMHGVVIVE